jgi:hypothetical protein
MDENIELGDSRMRGRSAFLAGVTAFFSGAAFVGKRQRPRAKEWSHTEREFIYNPTVLLLEVNLGSSQRMMELMQDDDFAQQLADVLASSLNEFCTRGGEILLRCSSDSARAVVAHLRGRGENYISFLNDIAPRPLKTEAGQVLAELDAIGWRQPTEAELAVLRAVEKLSDENGREAFLSARGRQG